MYTFNIEFRVSVKMSMNHTGGLMPTLVPDSHFLHANNLVRMAQGIRFLPHTGKMLTELPAHGLRQTQPQPYSHTLQLSGK